MKLQFFVGSRFVTINKKRPTQNCIGLFYGDNRTRTGYLQIANLSLYQVSYIPKKRINAM